MKKVVVWCGIMICGMGCRKRVMSDGVIYAIYSTVCNDNSFSVRMIMSYYYHIKRVIGGGNYIWYGI